jgi:hypothetical protein
MRGWGLWSNECIYGEAAGGERWDGQPMITISKTVHACCMITTPFLFLLFLPISRFFDFACAICQVIFWICVSVWSYISRPTALRPPLSFLIFIWFSFWFLIFESSSFTTSFVDDKCYSMMSCICTSFVSQEFGVCGVHAHVTYEWLDEWMIDFGRKRLTRAEQRRGEQYRKRKAAHLGECKPTRPLRECTRGYGRVIPGC